MRPGSDTPEHSGSRRPPTRPNIPGRDDPAPTRPNIPDPDDPATLRRRILARDSRGDALGVPEDEIEIARVHEEPGRLADDEHRVLPMDGVGQKRRAAAHGEIPEEARDDALTLTLGRDPLNEETHREERLTEKTDAEPKLINGHRHTLMVAVEWLGGGGGGRAGAETEGAYEARPNMARRTLYALRTSSGRRRPETSAKIFSGRRRPE